MVSCCMHALADQRLLSMCNMSHPYEDVHVGVQYRPGLISYTCRCTLSLAFSSYLIIVR